MNNTENFSPVMKFGTKEIYMNYLHYNKISNFFFILAIGNREKMKKIKS